MIPEAAVAAAVRVYLDSCRPIGLAEIEALLEAAAPHMEEAAYGRGFDDGHRAGQESMEAE